MKAEKTEATEQDRIQAVHQDRPWGMTHTHVQNSSTFTTDGQDNLNPEIVPLQMALSP